MSDIEIRLPSKVRIGPIEYDIDYVRDLTGDNGNELVGRAVYHKAQILIDMDQDDNVMPVTMLHEILHAILFQIGSKHCGDEKLMEGLSTGLLALLKDNPELVAYIMGEKMWDIPIKTSLPTLRGSFKIDDNIFPIYNMKIAAIKREGQDKEQQDE